MRTTLTLDPDVVAAVERLRRDEDLGLSEAVNRLVRRGILSAEAPTSRYRHHARPMGVRVDVTSIAAALELIADV